MRELRLPTPRVLNRAGLGAALVAGAAPARAQDGGIGAGIDGIVAAFERAVASISNSMIDVAITLIGSLLLIELVISLGRIVVTGAGLGELFATLLNRILIAGFYVFLMNNIPGLGGMNGFVGQTAEALAGLAGTGQAITPGELMSQSFVTFGALYDASSGIAGAVVAGLIGVVLVILTAMTVAMIVVAYVEVHIVFSLGVVALGFAGFSGTEDIARGFSRGALAKTLKLFAMLTLGSVMGTLFTTLGYGAIGASDEAVMTSGLTLVAAAVILFFVVLSVPSALEGVVMGIGGGSAAEGAGSATRGMAASAAGFAGGVGAGALVRTASGAAAGTAAGAAAAVQDIRSGGTAGTAARAAAKASLAAAMRRARE